MASSSPLSKINAAARALTLAVCVLSASAAAQSAAAELPPVDAAIVLLTDVSRSIDDSEFQLEKQGYATAFADPRVIAAIAGGPNARIAVTYLEFAGEDQVRTVVDWTVIDGAAAAAAFGGALNAAPRSYYGRTAIGSALIQAINALSEITSGNAGTRTVIDLAGDGTSNAGAPVTDARDRALAAGIIINGLAIINDHPVSYTFAHVQPAGGLTRWYRDNVTGGPGSFALEVRDFHSFGEAMVRKLLSEIAALPHGAG